VTAECVRQTLFAAGEQGIHTYRIPALACTPSGAVLAFCEGRRASRSDTGDIALVVRRSADGGRTWSAIRTVWADPGNTCGNPCPVVDRGTGIVWLLMTWNLGVDRESQIVAQTSRDTRRVFVTRSADDGLTWDRPREITDAVKRPEWTWYATGPGAGIRIEHGAWAGRLVVPCDHIQAGTRHYYAHVIYSDDQGRSWELGGSTPDHQVNECEVVEVGGGRLLLNMRNYDRAQRTRKVSLSHDGGASWGPLRADEALVEPICQASIRRYCWGSGGDAGVILFANPADAAERRNMTIRVSHDDAATWPACRTLHAGPAAYSCLAAMPDGDVGCLYECGAEHPYERIELACFPLSWIESRDEA